MEASNAAIEPVVVLIDGECNLCHGVAQFLIRRDKRDRYRFAALQSALGGRLLERGGLAGSGLDSFVVVERGRYYTKSAAAIRVLRNLGGAWTAAAALRIVPAALGDRVYDWVAAHRYGWFGKRDQCLLPTEEIRRKFIDGSYDGAPG